MSSESEIRKAEQQLNDSWRNWSVGAVLVTVLCLLVLYLSLAGKIGHDLFGPATVGSVIGLLASVWLIRQYLKTK